MYEWTDHYTGEILSHDTMARWLLSVIETGFAPAWWTADTRVELINFTTDRVSYTCDKWSGRVSMWQRSEIDPSTSWDD